MVRLRTFTLPVVAVVVVGLMAAKQHLRVVELVESMAVAVAAQEAKAASQNRPEPTRYFLVVVTVEDPVLLESFGQEQQGSHVRSLQLIQETYKVDQY
jgi:hypothetical protein